MKCDINLKTAFFILKFVFFITAISIFVTIGTISIHEISHSLTAKLYGCSYNQIIFIPGEMPNTEITCTRNLNINVITLAGLIATILISIIIFITSKGAIKYISLIIFSVGVIAANIDLVALSLKPQIIALLNILAYLLFSLTLIKIIILYFNKHFEDI
jgi:hypothetical protein